MPGCLEAAAWAVSDDHEKTEQVNNELTCSYFRLYFRNFYFSTLISFACSTPTGRIVFANSRNLLAASLT